MQAEAHESEVSLLNLLVVGAENIRLLIWGPLLTVLSTLATGFALLLFVFMRQVWRNAAQDPEAAPKITRLHAAFGTRKP